MMRACLQYCLIHKNTHTRLVILAIALCLPSQAFPQDADCSPGIAIQHTFASGAAWSICADVGNVQGLSIANAFYRAPGDLNRSVLAQASLSQILLHYHDRNEAEPQIKPSNSTTDVSNGSELVILNDQNCNAQILGTSVHPNTICERIISNGILAKFDQRDSVQTESWELASTISRETLSWNIAWTLTEDGQIRPRLSLSGRASRRNNDNRYAQQTRLDIPAMTRASILATWRLVPALDTDAQDSVEQFDYPLEVASGNRRPMQITPINRESFLSMNRENFRGWRILDSSGAGYYLDPANNGYSYTSAAHNWANFTLAVTREQRCEQYAVGNPDVFENTVCGTSLDDFVNEENLTDSNIVVWYNQTRHLDPTVEDWPIIRDVQLGFDLLPFDWTATSPFELVE